MRGAFVVISHTHVMVNEGQHKGKFQVHEMVEFVNSLKNKHYSNSTAIMDVKSRKLLKNRVKDSGATFDNLEDHIIKGYSLKYRQFLDLVGAEVPEKMISKKKEEETVEESSEEDAETDSN